MRMCSIYLRTSTLDELNILFWCLLFYLLGELSNIDIKWLSQ